MASTAPHCQHRPRGTLLFTLKHQEADGTLPVDAEPVRRRFHALFHEFRARDEELALGAGRAGAVERVDGVLAMGTVGKGGAEAGGGVANRAAVVAGLARGGVLGGAGPWGCAEGPAARGFACSDEVGHHETGSGCGSLLGWLGFTRIAQGGHVGNRFNSGEVVREKKKYLV